MKAKITATAKYLPERTLTNSDLEKMVETTDDWIKSRTGIEKRHLVGEGEATSDMGKEVALKLLKKSGLKSNSVGRMGHGLGLQITEPPSIYSKDETVLKIGKQYNAMEIFDNESGVNDAINLADQYLSDKNFDCSVIFPQDIPTMTSLDIDALLGFIRYTNLSLIHI